MTAMPFEPSPMVWLTAVQGAVYGVGWAVGGLHCRFERARTLSWALLMLASAAVIAALGTGSGLPAWSLAAYLIVAGALNFGFLALLIRRFSARIGEQARHDELTGLANRRALDLALQREWQRLQRGGAEFAVLALDLDHFKQVNDRYGHPAGDAMLAQVAQRLHRTAREVDMIARVGGEEFTVLVPHSGDDGAMAAAERLRAAVGAEPYAIPGASVPMTISVGVAIARQSDLDLADVLSRADQALYRAKGSGRDCVRFEQR